MKKYQIDAATIFSVATILGFVYFSSLPTTIPDADAGEFLILARNAGIAHPPGYPLYVQMLRIVGKWELFSSLVFQLALFSSVFVVSSAVLSSIVLLRLGVSNLATAVSVLAVYTTPGIWRVANTVEPFALNLFLISSVLLLSLLLFQSHRREMRFAALLGLCFGLGFSNHHALVLYAPLAGVCLLRGRVQSIKTFSKVCGVFFAGFFFGALPIVTLLSNAPASVLSWGPLNVRELLRHLLRSDYGTFQLSASENGISSGVGFFWSHLPSELGVLFLALATIGMLHLHFNGGRNRLSRDFSTARTFSLFCSFTFLLVAFGFYSLCNMNLAGAGQSILMRFFHVALPLLVVPLAMGIDFLLQARKLETNPWAAVAALFLICMHIQTRAGLSDRSTETFAEVDLRNTFSLLKSYPNPVLVTFSDAEFLGGLYAQSILGMGRQVVILHPSMWAHTSYRQSVLEKLGLASDAAKYEDDWKLAVQSTSKERAIFFSRADAALMTGWSGDLIRRVRLIQWIRPGNQPAQSEKISSDLNRFTFDLERPASGASLSPWELMIYSRYDEWFKDIQKMSDSNDLPGQRKSAVN